MADRDQTDSHGKGIRDSEAELFEMNILFRNFPDLPRDKGEIKEEYLHVMLINYHYCVVILELTIICHTLPAG
ncbi:MAG: hypothetical protein Kow0042_00410 [Calditrichia bacterium]